MNDPQSLTDWLGAVYWMDSKVVTSSGATISSKTRALSLLRMELLQESITVNVKEISDTVSSGSSSDALSPMVYSPMSYTAAVLIVRKFWTELYSIKSGSGA